MSVSYVYRVNRLEAFSTETGITISSNAFVDIPKMSISVNYDEDGNIKSTVHNESIRLVEKTYFIEHPSRKKKVNAYSGIVCVLTIFIFFIISALVHSKFFTTCSLFSLISICVTNTLIQFSSYVGTIVYMVRYPELSRFHSAEHMALMAYHKNERMPSMEEIKKTSRFDPNCSQVENIIIPFVTGLVCSIILTVVITGIHYGLIEVLGQIFDTKWSMFILPVFLFFYMMSEKLVSFITELIRKVFTHESIVKLFQWPLLWKPTERELILAEEALRQRELLDQDIMEHAGDYIAEGVSFNPKEDKTLYILENGNKLYTTIDEYIDWIQSYKKAEVIEKEDDEDRQ